MDILRTLLAIGILLLASTGFAIFMAWLLERMGLL